MRHRLLLAGVFLLGSCFKSSGSGSGSGGATPSNKTGRSGVDYSATIADPVGFLPIDSEVVLSLDAEQLRRSPVWSMLETKLLAAAGPDLQMFKAVCGFDPVTSIRGITIGIKNLKQDTPDGILVVSGLDRARLTACMDKARQQGDQAVQVAADGTVTIAAEGAGDTPVVFGFVDASTAVAMIGPATSSSAFAAALAAGSPLRKSPAFGELIGRVNLESALWTVINGNSSVFEQAAALGMKPRAIVGSVSLASGLDASVRIRLSTPQEAQQITTMAQGQLGMATNFFEKLEVTADGTDVAVLAVMTDAQVQNMLSIANGMLGNP
jgi:hypothetical protein